VKESQIKYRVQSPGMGNSIISVTKKHIGPVSDISTSHSVRLTLHPLHI